MAEVGPAAVVVRERRVVHDLQEDGEQVGMGFFDFVQQQHRMGFFRTASVSSPPSSNPT